LTIKPWHIGELLIAAILGELSSSGQLDAVRCSITNSSLAYELGEPAPQFLADEAIVEVQREGRSYSCDGAQTIDVLCMGAGSAIALEAKLGDARMSRRSFQNRFCADCSFSAHGQLRLNGSMVAILDGLLPFPDGQVFAVANGQARPLCQHWWLVVRHQVLTSWNGSLPVRNARVVTLERLASLLGREEVFDALVRRIIGNGFAASWNLVFDL
jgi:hypothetical protein